LLDSRGDWRCVRHPLAVIIDSTDLSQEAREVPLPLSLLTPSIALDAPLNYGRVPRFIQLLG
jgi:hypothetical protein